jgi:hypothetical protein
LKGNFFFEIIFRCVLVGDYGKQTQESIFNEKFFEGNPKDAKIVGKGDQMVPKLDSEPNITKEKPKPSPEKEKLQRKKTMGSQASDVKAKPRKSQTVVDNSPTKPTAKKSAQPASVK